MKKASKVVKKVVRKKKIQIIKYTSLTYFKKKLLKRKIYNYKHDTIIE